MHNVNTVNLLRVSSCLMDVMGPSRGGSVILAFRRLRQEDCCLRQHGMDIDPTKKDFDPTKVADDVWIG